MPGDFDAVDLERLRRRRTVKWSLYGPDVLAAWVAEMDFDVAPVVRAAINDAVDREDFGYVAADLTDLTTACAAFHAERYGWARLAGAHLPGCRRAHRHRVPRSTRSSRPAHRLWCRRPRTRRSSR